MAVAPARGDTTFLPVLLFLRECLGDALADASPSAPLCMTTIVPGNTPDLSGVNGGRGLAYVRIVGAQNSTGGLTPSAVYTPCGETLMASVEIAVWRCAPVSVNSYPISSDDWVAATVQQMADHAAIVRALCCTTDRLLSEGVDAQVMFSASSFVGPEGGVLGTLVQVNVAGVP